MATQQSLTFYLGEDWIIELACRDADGSALANLADVQLVLSTLQGDKLLEQTVANGARANQPIAGAGLFRVQPSSQAPFSPGRYDYQARAILTDGTITTQAAGIVTLVAGLF